MSSSKYVFVVSLWLTFVALVCLTAGDGGVSTNAKGPLRVHPKNPRYFTDGTGRAVYLTGSHTWDNLCLAKLPVAFAANYSGIRACAKNRAILCLTKCYPALNHAELFIAGISSSEAELRRSMVDHT
jgi:hypothetical protein